MHGSHQLLALETIVTYSYIAIALGYGIRQKLEKRPVLLWPWLLLSIFLLCASTRLIGFAAIQPPLIISFLLEASLAAIALAYAVGQLLYAVWPTLFEEDTRFPSWTTLEEGLHPSEPTVATPSSKYFRSNPPALTPDEARESDRTPSDPASCVQPQTGRIR
jgi:hypothetical protein